PFESTCIHSNPLVSIRINSYPFELTRIHSYPLVSTCIHSCPFESARCCSHCLEDSLWQLDLHHTRDCWLGCVDVSSVVCPSRRPSDANHLFSPSLVQIPEILVCVKEEKDERTPNLSTFTEHFNNISFWTRSQILRCEE